MNIVYSEIKKLVIPIFVLDFVLITIFFITKQSNFVDIITIILSSLYSVLNIYMVGTAIVVAVEKTENKARNYMILHYFVRYIITGSIIYYAFIISWISPLAVIIPLFFPKIILVFRSTFNNKKGGEF